SYTCDEGDMVYLTLSGVRVYYTCEGNTWVPVPVSSSSSSVVSSSSASSSSSYYDMDSLFNGGLSYGEFTDPRDGQKYKTIVIPDEDFEYFAENLNYGKQVGLGEAQTDSTKYCYDDDAWYCGHHFGGLYRWSTAMGFPAACDSVEIGSSSACPDTIPLPVFTSYPEEAPFYVQIQGICPDGWHVMNEGEWDNILGGGMEDRIRGGLE
ncbi:MAG: FISUMP domain-containing protein, partial [Fibrobacteraceae bacterium]